MDMNFFDKIRGKKTASRIGYEDNLPKKIVVPGLQILAKYDIGDDDLQLPVRLWGHFDKVISHLSFSHEIMLTSTIGTPPDLTTIRALFDDLYKSFGSDSHGAAGYDEKDGAQWETLRTVGRGYYLHGKNLETVQFDISNPINENTIDLPAISVYINKDVVDPEIGCQIEFKQWRLIQETLLRSS